MLIKIWYKQAKPHLDLCILEFNIILFLSQVGWNMLRTAIGYCRDHQSKENRNIVVHIFFVEFKKKNRNRRALPNYLEGQEAWIHLPMNRLSSRSLCITISNGMLISCQLIVITVVIEKVINGGLEVFINLQFPAWENKNMVSTSFVVR